MAVADDEQVCAKAISKRQLLDLAAAQGRVCEEIHSALLHSAPSDEAHAQLRHLLKHHQEVLMRYNIQFSSEKLEALDDVQRAARTGTKQDGFHLGRPAQQLDRQRAGQAQASSQLHAELSDADLEAGCRREVLPALARRSTLLVMAASICGILLVAYTSSAPLTDWRSIMSTCAFAIALHLIIDARRGDSGAAGVGLDRRVRLFPRLALLYLCHWSVDCGHMLIAGTAHDAAKIATQVLASEMGIAVLFGMVTAALGIDPGTDAAETMAHIVATQGVLGLRAYVVWCQLRTTAGWEGAAAAEFARAAARWEVVFPLITLALARVWARSVSPTSTSPC